ncbi:MAG: PAS domain S-box protein [Pedobacter sp.]|nr:MAG: PAS domain S-box protein [Pedobacter sp.]
MQFTDGQDLHKIIAHAPIGMCLLDAETQVAEMVNEKFLEVAGKPYDAVMGQFYWDAFAEVRSVYQAALSSVIETGKAFYADEVEMMLIRHGREEIIVVTFVYAPVTNPDGKVIKVAIWVLENTKQITQQKLAEAEKTAFQKERDRLEDVFMKAPSGICILNGKELVYELINPAYQRMLIGRDLLNRPILEALPELSGTQVEAAMLKVFETGEPYEVSNQLIPVADAEGGNTQNRYFSFSFQARRNENGEIDGIVNIVNEVTENIEIQLELQHAREEANQQKRVYEAIISGTPDLMYVWDLEYNFTYVNKALLTMWGKTWDTAIGKGLRENGYEEWHAAMHEREIDEVAATKASIRGEVSFPHAVLGRRVYDYILIPVLNEDGEVEAVAGTTRDVTERKQMESALAQNSEELQAINEEMMSTNEEQAASNEELMAANSQLAALNEELSAAQNRIEESEIMLRLAIDAASIGTWYINSATRELVSDHRLKELFGYFPEDSLSIEQAVAQVNEEYRSFVSGKLENAIYKGGDFDITYPVTGFRDQRSRWLRAIGNLKADPSGAFSAFTGVVMDVTEQHIDEQRKNDFIGMVSHELKTPLTSLTFIIQLSDRKLKDSEDPFLAGVMEKANLQVKRMSNMINGFLNVSRLESAKLQIFKKEFNLVDLIEEVIRENVATLSNHVITLNNHPPIVLINADLEKIGSVITNLISNAVKYSPKGKEIVVNYELVEDKVYVSVADQGMGIKPGDQEKVFERYYRVENMHTQHISGFGIGLYLSAEIVKRHDGEIWVESEPGVGSTFYFSLPVM